MTYKKIIILFLFFVFAKSAFCAEFGEYRYSKYMGLQQQLQRQRLMNTRMHSRYNTSPTRNIRYPTSSNPYPNIQRTRSRSISAYQRYSPSYYQNNY